MGGQMADTDATIREMIDKAIGVLMTLRGCSEQAAFDELVVALQDIGVDPSGVGGGFMWLKCGKCPPTVTTTPVG